MRTLGIVEAGGTPTSDELNDGLEALYFMLRFWGIKGLVVPFVSSENFSLTGATSYTIGSGGDFDTVRPTRIVGAYTRAGSLDSHLKIIGGDKYRALAQKSTSGTGAWLYYNPTSPLGTIYLYPLSSDTIYLDSYKQLTDPATLATDTGFAPEFDEAIKFNLALRLAPEFGKSTPNEVAHLAKETLSAIVAYNAAMLAMNPAKVEIFNLSRRWTITEG